MSAGVAVHAELELPSGAEALIHEPLRLSMLVQDERFPRRHPRRVEAGYRYQPLAGPPDDVMASLVDADCVPVHKQVPRHTMTTGSSCNACRTPYRQSVVDNPTIYPRTSYVKCLLLAALLVVGCGVAPATSAPSVTMTPEPTTATQTVAPSVAPSVAAATCSPVVTAGLASVGPLVEQLSVAFANEDADEIADVAFRAGQLANEVRREATGETAALFSDLEDAASEEPTTVADALPLIEALSALVDASC